MRRVVLLHIFVNLFNVWLDRKQLLQPYICFHIQGVVLIEDQNIDMQSENAGVF